MLFNYRYVNHTIERFQDYLDHVVKEVWCKASGPFSIDLLHSELQEIVLEIYNTEEDTTRGKVGDWLYGPIRNIHEIFRTQLTPEQRDQVSEWYDRNNDIEGLCGCVANCIPVTYADIRQINADLEVALKAFCKSLFTDVIHLRAVTSRIGAIEEHYEVFDTANDGRRCPYCGYGDFRAPYLRRREAYDHFLPKGTYPFNTVNFRNLAPMCHECNSTYKLQKDPITREKDGTRRKAFYSYAAMEPGIKIQVTLKTKDIARLVPAEIELQLDAPGRDEEIESWKDVFGIENRFKAKLCGKNDGKAWLAKVLDENENVGLTRVQMLRYELDAAATAPFADTNFLKKPFLLACKNAGILGE